MPVPALSILSARVGETQHFAPRRTSPCMRGSWNCAGRCAQVAQGLHALAVHRLDHVAGLEAQALDQAPARRGDHLDAAAVGRRADAPEVGELVRDPSAPPRARRARRRTRSRPCARHSAGSRSTRGGSGSVDGRRRRQRPQPLPGPVRGADRQRECHGRRRRRARLHRRACRSRSTSRYFQGSWLNGCFL